MGNIEPLSVVHENKLMIELVKQYGQIMTAFVQSERSMTTLAMDNAMKTLERYMQEASTNESINL